MVEQYNFIENRYKPTARRPQCSDKSITNNPSVSGKGGGNEKQHFELQMVLSGFSC